jgi:hypothetical protein
MADEIVSLDKIKKVRARVEVSMVDARSALTAAAGDVETAVRALMTPEQIARDRNAAIAETIVAEASRGAPPPAPAGPPPRSRPSAGSSGRPARGASASSSSERSIRARHRPRRCSIRAMGACSRWHCDAGRSRWICGRDRGPLAVPRSCSPPVESTVTTH